MTRLASRFGAANLIRRDRPLTREELFRVVPSVFSEDKHASRSERYTYIPTISLLDSLQREGFQPFLPVRPGYATRVDASTQNTCYAFVGRGRLPVNRYQKLSCSTPMMAPVRTRCCRVYFVRFVRTGSSAVSHLARCVCRTKAM